ncbi:MAG TPA: glutathione peroxidase [Candidatus Eisenbacteria bacterium]|nr:glutathione peroxidase [Candidatus Eisenbacteria bacterium]
MTPLGSSLLAVAFGLLGGAVTDGAGAAPAPAAPKSVHDFSVVTIDGTTRPLADYRGKVLLIVNTASKCGFTSQYESLESLYGKYRERGFEVLAFPANDFMGQEPGTNEEIKAFCATNYKTTFPLFAKISVKGKKIHPLYEYLTRDSGFPGAVSWNFNKFLVGPDGRVAARWGSPTDPLAKSVTSKIEALLPARS